MAHTIRVEVVSAEEQIFAGEAEFVVLPGIMGELGIYPRHTPLLTQIKPGAVRLKLPNQDQEELVFVQGGFLEVQPNLHRRSGARDRARAARGDPQDAPPRLTRADSSRQSARERVSAPT